MDNIRIVRLSEDNFHENSLDTFLLQQQVCNCWRRVNDTYELLPVSYREDWDLSERRNMAKKILSALCCGSTAIAAMLHNTVIGFALLSDTLFGSNKQYIDLAEFYMSAPYRRRGIGQRIFEAICLAAKNTGAKKLYISAHSAEESIAAYRKYGCTYAEEPDAVHREKEPYDLQLEYDLTARIYAVENKEDYMPLLLMADEQQNMIARYLPQSRMYVMNDCGIKGEISVSDAGNGVLEIKNLAVLPQYRHCGYGKKLIEFICAKYKGSFAALIVGTGDSPLTLPFYKKCGFRESHIVKDFFIKYYDHPIIEAGKQLKDMIYLKKEL